MRKQIKIEYNDVEYVLEYTRNSVVEMERNNFNITKLKERPIEMVTKLYDGAFISHHPRMEESIKQEIYEQIPNKDKFIEKLAEMYNETLTTLIGDSDKGKAKWEVNW